MTSQQSVSPNQNGSVPSNQNTAVDFDVDDDFPLPRTFSDPHGESKTKIRERTDTNDSDSIQLWNPSESRLRTASESVVKRDKKGKFTKK